MKLIVQKLAIATALVCTVCMQAAIAAPSPAEGKPADRVGYRLFKKSKTKYSRNNHVVRIYPDPVRRAIHVVAKETIAREIDFFVFDLEGTLVEHYKIGAGKKQKLTELKRGTYIYRVFAGDEETVSGRFDVR